MINRCRLPRDVVSKVVFPLLFYRRSRARISCQRRDVFAKGTVRFPLSFIFLAHWERVSVVAICLPALSGNPPPSYTAHAIACGVYANARGVRHDAARSLKSLSVI